MNSILIILSLVSGAAFLYIAGDILVENSKRLGLRLKIDPLVIGLTIVAFGTSAPELFVSAQGALTGQTDIALGNVVGSNTTNILLILGLSAIINPITIAKRTIVKDIPIMVATSFLLLLFSLDLVIGRLDGIILILGLILFCVYEIRLSKISKSIDTMEEIADVIEDSLPKNEIYYILGALVGLMFGSKLLIFGSTEIARSFGISELVIGLTIVALGTSLPEVVTSCLAAKKGESSIAIGNVVGSNIFNVLGVMGISSTLSPIPVPLAALSFDIPIMIFSSLICLPIVYTDKKITKSEGILLLGLYVFYIIYLILISKEHATVPVISEITLAFIIPLSLYYYLKSKKIWESKN